MSDAAILVSKARKLQLDGNATSWELADCYLALKEKHGWSDQLIADECGVSRTSVQRFRSCAARLPTSGQRPSFWEAFRKTKTSRREPDEADDETDEDEDEEDVRPSYEAAVTLNDVLDLLGRLEATMSKVSPADVIALSAARRDAPTSQFTGMLVSIVRWLEDVRKGVEPLVIHCSTKKGKNYEQGH